MSSLKIPMKFRKIMIERFNLTDENYLRRLYLLKNHIDIIMAEHFYIMCYNNKYDKSYGLPILKALINKKFNEIYLKRAYHNDKENEIKYFNRMIKNI